jgi:hypothetical protein
MAEIYRYVNFLVYLRRIHTAIIISTRCIKPKGYRQLGEMGVKSYSDGNTLNPGIQRHFDLCNEAMAKLNRPFPVGATLKKYLEDAGFVDVVCVDLKQPLRPWPKDKRMKIIGAMTMLMCETGG